MGMITEHEVPETTVPGAEATGTEETVGTTEAAAE